MAHWKTFVRKDSKFLTFYDLEGKTPLDVTIENYSMEEAHNPGDHQDGELLCLKFKGAKKLLGLNNTNAFLIETKVGDPNPESWKGQVITLRCARCKSDECIRLDAPKGTKMPGHYPKWEYLD